MSNRHDAARPLVLNILRKCVERCDALDMKGKKADEMALHYLAGACVALEGDPIAYNWIGNIMALSVSVRGMMAVREAIATISKQEARA